MAVSNATHAAYKSNNMNFLTELAHKRVGCNRLQIISSSFIKNNIDFKIIYYYVKARYIIISKLM